MTALLALALAAGPPLLTLDEALERARAHPRLLEARAAARQAEARVDQARAAFLPSGSAQLGTGLSAVPGRPPGPGEGFLSGSVSLSQPIWDFGRATGGLGAARAGREAADQDLALTRLDVELDVRVAYHNALAAAQAVAVADDAIRQMEKRLAFAQAAVAVGRRTRFDVVKAEVDLTGVRIQRLQALNLAATSRTALASAIGGELGEAALADPPEPPAAAPDLAEVVARALAARPDLLALDRRVAAQQAQLDAARAAFWPVLGAGAQASALDRGVPAAWGWQAGVTLSWPFLAGGADAARAREAEAQVEQLRAARDALALQVRAEAESTALAVIEAVARHEAARGLLEQARESLALAEGRYQAGAGSVLEVADAQAAFTAAGFGLVRAHLDVATARARLVRATGGP